MPSPLSQTKKEYVKQVFAETKSISKTISITNLSRNTIRKVIRQPIKESLPPKLSAVKQHEMNKRERYKESVEAKKQLWSDSYSSFNELFSESKFNFFAGELPPTYRLRIQGLIKVLKEEFNVELTPSLNLKIEMLAEQLLTYKKYQMKVITMLRQSDDQYQVIHKASPVQYAKMVVGFETCANNALKTIFKILDDLETQGQNLRFQKQVTTTIKNGVVTQEKIQNKVST